MNSEGAAWPVFIGIIEDDWVRIMVPIVHVYLYDKIWGNEGREDSYRDIPAS